MTYQELQQAVADTLNRQDLATDIVRFIALAEDEMDTDPRLRLQRSVVLARTIAQSEWTLVPRDYLRMQALRVTPRAPNRNPALEFRTSAQMDQLVGRTGDPQWYCVVGRRIRLAPVPINSVGLEMEYFSQLPRLSNTNPTNWLLDWSSNLYLYKTLAQAELFLMNDERVEMWEALYDKAASSLHDTDQWARYSGAPMKMRNRSF